MTELHSGREPAAWEHGVGDSLDWRKALDCFPCPSPVPPNSGHHWSCLGWEGGDTASGFLGPALRRLLRPVLQRLLSRSSRGLRTRLQYFVLCYYLFFCNSFIEKYTIQFAHLNYHSMTQLNGKNRQPSPHSFVSILIFSNENQLPFGCHRCNPHPSRPLASTNAPSVSITHITLVESYNTWPLVTGFFHLE